MARKPSLMIISLTKNLGTPDELIKPTNKKAVSIFEQVAPELKTNDKKEATYKGVAWEVKGKGSVVSQSLTNVQVK